jgi:hypothetical protein
MRGDTGRPTGAAPREAPVLDSSYFTALWFGGAAWDPVLHRLRIIGISRATPTLLAATMIPPGSQSPLARTITPKIRQAPRATVMIAARRA